MVSREAQPCCFSVFIVLHMINKKRGGSGLPIFLVFHTVLIVVFVVHLLMTVNLLVLFAVTAATTATVTLRCLVLAEQENRARNN